MLRQAQHERKLTGMILGLTPFALSLSKGERDEFLQPAGVPRRRLRVHNLLLFVLLFLGSTVIASPSTTQEVEEALTCQCSCGLTVHSCNHLQCSFAVPAKQTIAEQVSQGKGKEEIIAAFVTRYGEKVLSSPTTSGFNLVAWIAPFLALLVGGVLIGIMSLRWAQRRSPSEPEKQPTSVVVDQYRARLKKELDSFDV